MSEKKQKLLRKLARQELEKIKSMQPNPQQEQQLGLQILKLLEEYINLCTVLTGEKPQTLMLTDVMYNAFVQESQRHAEVLGLKPGFKDEKPTFNGVELVKKSPIISPNQSMPAN